MLCSLSTVERGNTQTHRQQGDRISLLLFFKIRKVELVTPVRVKRVQRLSRCEEREAIFYLRIVVLLCNCPLKLSLPDLSSLRMCESRLPWASFSVLTLSGSEVKGSA
jgi:hypothetical protein